MKVVTHVLRTACVLRAVVAKMISVFLTAVTDFATATKTVPHVQMIVSVKFLSDVPTDSARLTAETESVNPTKTVPYAPMIAVVSIMNTAITKPVNSPVATTVVTITKTVRPVLLIAAVHKESSA